MNREDPDAGVTIAGDVVEGDAAAPGAPWPPGGLRRPRGATPPRPYYRIANLRNIAGVSWLFGILFVLLAALPALVDRGWYWAFLPVIPLLGAYVYKLTIVMHECCHGTLFTSRSANLWLGIVCGGWLGASFRGFCETHWDHHRHCGSDEDTGEVDYIHLERATRREIVVHLLRPLTGAAWLGILRDYGRRLVSAPSVTLEVRPSGAGLEPWLQLAIIVAVQLLIAAVATGGGRHLWLVVAYPLTAATLGLFFSRVRAFCEHVSVRREDGQCFVRSHVPNWFDRLFFYTLNMNMHVEHHLFPQVPARNLPLVKRDLERVGYYRDDMTSPSIFRTIAGCLAEARELHARPARRGAS